MVTLINRNGFYCKTTIDNPVTFTDKMDALLRKVMVESNIPFREFLGLSRKRDVVEWRQLAMFIAAHNNYGNLVQIGVYFNRHWATVIHARERISDGLEINDPFILRKLWAMHDFIQLKHYPKPKSNEA
jgi:chromosomal replication initiation ATPase DnaA